MNINPINFNFLSRDFKINSIKNNITTPKTLKKDVFEHSNTDSNLSFKGSMEDMAAYLAKDPDNLCCYIIQLQNTSLEEITTEKIIDILSKKHMQQIMTRLKTQKIDNFLAKTVYNSQDFAKLCLDSGIVSTAHAQNFIKMFQSSNSKKIFQGQCVEAIKIYGLLKRKDDFKNFGEILLYIYNEESDKRPSRRDFSKLNKTTDFLKEINISRFSDFDKNFAHLKHHFNNFEDLSDKMDAIEYLQKTYADKTEKLKDILESQEISKSPQSVYSSINDVVDCIYINERKNLSSLSEIIEIALQSNKIKGGTLEAFKPYFNNFEFCEDKINFYKFLKECNVSINDLIALTSKDCVNQPGLAIKKVKNKNYLTELIAEINDVKKGSAFEIYKNFADILNAFCTDDDCDIETIKNILNIIKTYNLKSSQGFLNLYNKMSCLELRFLEKCEIEEFCELFNYSTENILQDAKIQDISPLELLKQRKNEFFKVKDEIETFLVNDDSNYFLGKEALDIFTDFYEFLSKSRKTIQDTLEDIKDFEIVNTQECKQKAKKLGDFSKFFENKQELLKFFSTNKISFFDENQKEKEYQKNCLEILDTVYDKNDKESKENIEYLTNSGFLIKSRNLLGEFLNKTQETEKRKEILSIIVDKKIPSLNSLESFLKQYKNPDSTEETEENKKLTQYLSKISSKINFNQNRKTLESLQKRLDKLNIPTKLNSSNIVNIDCSKFKNGSISDWQIPDILELLQEESQKGNFLTTMPNNKDLNSVNNQYRNPFRIAREIVSKNENSSEPYKNITSLLGLDKKTLDLDDDCSLYIYTKAVENALNKDFIDFVNSNKWMEYNDKQAPCLTLHARLRAIERFGLKGCKNIEELYTKETTEKLNALFKTIYTQKPTQIKGSESDKRIIADFNHNSNIIEAVFSDKGDMITVVEKSR